MNAYSYITDRRQDLVNDLSNFLGRSHFQNLLSEVIAELVNHDVLEDREKPHNQGLLKELLRAIFVKSLLQHPATCLIIAIKSSLVNYLLIFSTQSVISTKKISRKSMRLVLLIHVAIKPRWRRVHLNKLRRTWIKDLKLVDSYTIWNVQTTSTAHSIWVAHFFVYLGVFSVCSRISIGSHILLWVTIIAKEV